MYIIQVSVPESTRKKISVLVLGLEKIVLCIPTISLLSYIPKFWCFVLYFTIRISINTSNFKPFLSFSTTNSQVSIFKTNQDYVYRFIVFYRVLRPVDSVFRGPRTHSLDIIHSHSFPAELQEKVNYNSSYLYFCSLMMTPHMPPAIYCSASVNIPAHASFPRVELLWGWNQNIGNVIKRDSRVK